MTELCKAAAFVVTTFDGTTAGVGLLCVDCRYASVRWPGVDRIDRRLGTKTPAILDALLSEAGELLRTGPKAKVAPFMKLESTLTCPACGVVVVETMLAWRHALSAETDRLVL